MRTEGFDLFQRNSFLLSKQEQETQNSIIHVLCFLFLFCYFIKSLNKAKSFNNKFDFGILPSEMSTKGIISG